MGEENVWKEKGDEFLRIGKGKEAYQAYSEALYLTERKNAGRALNDIDEWIEAIYENPDYDRKNTEVRNLIRGLYLHKAKIYGRVEHYTESKKALTMAGYEYAGLGLPSQILKYIEDIESTQ